MGESTWSRLIQKGLRRGWDHRNKIRGIAYRDVDSHCFKLCHGVGHDLK